MAEVLYTIQLLPSKKWYVGKTKNYNRRMDQHLENENGAAGARNMGLVKNLSPPRCPPITLVPLGKTPNLL